MKTLNDLKLCPKAKAKVEEWLNEWIGHFMNLADGREGNVYRADFEKMDLFYFTDCKDLISKDVESKGQESNKRIIKRKRMILLQLLLRVLSGEEVGRKITCTHCGFDDVYIGSRPSGGGHYMFCPKCGKTDVCTYPDFYNSTMDEVKSELVKKGFISPIIRGIPEIKKICKKCGKAYNETDFTYTLDTCNYCYYDER